MSDKHGIIGIDPWLETPAGRYLLDWEQARLDAMVADIFGFHALQLGWPHVDGLRHNRMPHRWFADDHPASPDAAPLPLRQAAILTDFDELPFASGSLDLVLLPHTLEVACDPHRTLREVERVLVPEGRVVVVGLNPASLWGVRQRAGRLARRLGLGTLFLPEAGEFIGPGRLRDWMRLLDLDIEHLETGCWRPPLRSQRWLDRWDWMDEAGARWWPVFGAVYVMVAVKRVRGMRLVGRQWKRRRAGVAGPAVAASSRGMPLVWPVSDPAASPSGENAPPAGPSARP